MRPALVVTAAVVVVLLATGGVALASANTGSRPLVAATPRSAPGAAPVAAPGAEAVGQDVPAPAAVTISVLSDSHAYFADSWWRQTVEAQQIDGVIMGAFASQPGADSLTIASGVDEAAGAAPGGYVAVQAGTNDLLGGSSPEQAARGIEALWSGVRARGATPIAVLVPPSSRVGAEVLELNRLLASAAAAQGIAILDVFSPVAQADGTWVDGDSDDGKHANLVGSTVQAEEVLRQLPGILTGRQGQLVSTG